MIRFQGNGRASATAPRGEGSRRELSLIAAAAAQTPGPVVVLWGKETPGSPRRWIRRFGERLVVITEGDVAAWRGAARVFPSDGRNQTDTRLAECGPAALIVDLVAVSAETQFGRWERFCFNVAVGGSYVLRQVDQQWWTARIAAGAESRTAAATQELIASAAAARPVGSMLALPKIHHHLLKVNELEADVLAAREPGLKIAVVTTRPAVDVVAPVRVVCHSDEEVSLPETSWTAPPLTCRWYRGDLHIRDWLYTQHGQTILPPSFRHGWSRRPNQESVAGVGRRFAVAPALGEPLDLPGTYFDVSGALPGHFGHIITESLAKLWAWPQARAAIPDLKALCILPPGQERPRFEDQLFAAAGVAAEDVVYLPQQELRLHSLVAPTAAWHNAGPYHYHPVIRDTWAAMRAALVGPADDASPRRVFVSRGTDNRACLNKPEVEAWFAEQGFAIVYPERLSIQEQAQVFGHAEVLAGFAGSAMFNALYSAGLQRMIVLTHTQYRARNEWLYGAALAEELHYFFSEPVNHRSQGATGRAAFHSPWSFDFQRYGAELSQACR